MLIFVYAALWNANRIRSNMKNMLFTKMLSPNGLNANKSSAHLRNKVVPSQVVLSRLNILNVTFRNGMYTKPELETRQNLYFENIH